MNEQFLERIREYIPDEIETFEASLEQPLYQGLRANPIKCDPQELAARLDFLGDPSPFAKNAWYIQGSYGLHPYHMEGKFYLQEPSAGSAVQALNVQPDDVVLDLCAAPGSKSTQIAGYLTGKNGFLVSNEIDAKRAQALLSNMERIGLENFAVTNMDSKTLCRQFPETFDKILVDAPCSGEGMMKKHAAAKDEWSLENIQVCSARQKEILANAIPALKPGGEMVYSTCTYAKEENEEVTAWILENYPEMEQIDILPEDMNFGRPGFETPGMDASKVRRIFPMDKGEGHYIARFRKAAAESQPSSKKSSKKAKAAKEEKLDKSVLEFLNEQLGSDDIFEYIQMDKSKDKTSVYGMHRPFWNFKKGKVLRQGVYIGDVIKNRFEPAHAFYMGQSMLDGKTKTEVSLEQMDQFVHGQQLNLESPKGYRALCYEGVPFGFGKSDGRRITNKYPKGLRLNPGSHVNLFQDEKSADSE